ncbi:MAG: photosynthetic complex putative assembly protein PuhB [Pseudomonadota bacterium]
MPQDDDFAEEPIHGLAKKLPEGERILWQGAPTPLALARQAMGLTWILGYFAVLAVWRGGMVAYADGAAAGALSALWYVVAGLAAGGVVLGLAWVLARTTVYTVTSARVVMRIGAALTVSLNLPLKDIASAELGLARDGTGSIHLALKGDTRVAYLVLWPHARPWRLARPEPTLRAIPDAAHVARLLGQAAEARVGAVAGEILEPAPQAAAPAPIPAE